MCVHDSGILCVVHVFSAFISSGGVSGTEKNMKAKKCIIVELINNSSSLYPGYHNREDV